MPLLKKSGARDVKAVSLETPRLPPEAFNAAETLFQTRVKEALDADPHGKIQGRIVDGHHRPMAGASVRATLQLRIMLVDQPGRAGTYIRYRGPAERFGTRSGDDGRFALSGLCKGGYVLKVESPGRAWLEHMVFIAPISIRHRSSSAWIRGTRSRGRSATRWANRSRMRRVIPTWRQHFEDGEFRYNADVRHLEVMADEAGRFQLAGLQHGHYIVEVKAPGFKDRELEPIPAGNDNVVVTLDRWQ